LDELRANKVSGGKLVYTLWDMYYIMKELDR
jgi:hypothetical protein